MAGAVTENFFYRNPWELEVEENFEWKIENGTEILRLSTESKQATEHETTARR